ncbi:MAG: CPBP family intramembrane metalloprotease [Bacteroidales bacterium]|nr:CPBP family intramembrane metalloprotease [Bacteroidales bacterium]
MGIFVIHTVSYVSVLFLIKIFRKNTTFFTSIEFWIKIIAILFLLSLDRALSFYSLASDLPFQASIYVHRNVKNVFWIVSILIPCYIMYRVWDKKTDNNFYGFSFKNLSIKTILSLLSIVVFLTLIASFSDDFQHQYPSYKEKYGLYFIENNILEKWQTVAIFEFCYLFDFISVELIFRGFLILALVKFLNKDTILPMVTLYVVLHFGKPLGETISSAFGGYILGVVAYYTRSIWLGIILHISLAFFMDFFAFLQHLI